MHNADKKKTLFERYCEWAEHSKVGKVVDKIFTTIPWCVWYVVGYAIGAVIALKILSICK